MTELGVTSQKKSLWDDCRTKKDNNNGKTDRKY